MIDKNADTPVTGCQDCGDEGHEVPEMPQLPDPEELHILGVAWVDGACKVGAGPMGFGAVIELYTDDELATVRYSGGGVSTTDGTNNQAEYLGLLEAIELFAAELQPVMMNPATTTIRPDSLTTVEILINMDSELVVKQMNGEYEVKNERLQQFWNVAQQRLEMMRQYGVEVTIKWIPRDENAPADKLANAALGHLAAEDLLYDPAA